VQERYEYDPYGVASVLAPDFTARGVSDFEWETTYCGYRWDAVSGLFAVRNRFYHPVLGVWLTRDPIGYAAGDVNQVRYVGNGGGNVVDPSGLEVYIVNRFINTVVDTPRLNVASHT
jgi:RHS repeat-associated protein